MTAATATVPAAPAPEHQRPIRRLHRRTIVLLVVALLVVAAGAAWVVAFSPLLAVRDVVISGDTRVSVAKLRSVAGVDLGTPLLRVDLAAVQRRLDALPQVASATVRRDWPQRLVISVVAAQPVATMRDGAGYALLDRDGQVLATVTRRPTRLPFVDHDSIGLRGNPATMAAAAVAVGLPPSLAKRVSSITADSAYNVHLLLRNGIDVSWGSAEEPAAKARSLRLLLKAAPKASAYDVSAPRSVSVRP